MLLGGVKNIVLSPIKEIINKTQYDWFPGKSQNSKKFHTKNKTQYDWFPGKSQNSKKFSAKFKQNPTTSKNHRVFLNILKG